MATIAVRVYVYGDESVMVTSRNLVRRIGMYSNFIDKAASVFLPGVFGADSQSRAGHLIACDAVGSPFDYFLQRTFGYQSVGKLTVQRCGVSPQCREGNVAFGFGALGIDDSCLGDSHGFGKLARGHA